MALEGEGPLRVDVLVLVGLLLVCMVAVSGLGAATGDPGDETTESTAIAVGGSGIHQSPAGYFPTIHETTDDERWSRSPGPDNDSRSPDNSTANDSTRYELNESHVPTDVTLDTLGSGPSAKPEMVILEATNASRINTSRIRALGAEVGSRHGRHVEVTAAPETVRDIRQIEWVRGIRPVTPSIAAEFSEGVASMNALQLHRRGVTGEGVKVGVLTGGVRPHSPEYADQVVATNSFHPAGLTADDPTHGTGVAEIVSDTAPNASLYLTSHDTNIDYANAVSWLLEQDVDIIVMSRMWYGTPETGESFVSRQAANAVDNGVFWANSAGNAAQKHWQGTYEDPDGDGWLNFNGEDEGNSLNDGRRMEAGTNVRLYIKWHDFPTTDDDYTLYLYDEDSNIIGSTEEFNAADNPVERLNVTLPRDGEYYYAIRGDESPHTIEVIGSDSVGEFEYEVAEGSLLAPGVAEGVTAVGAYHVDTGERAEYSSVGPTNDGRRGVDILGPSKVTTQAYDGSFTGTSAAAPHIAGAAALLLDVDDSASPEDLEAALMESAEDVGPAGHDVYSGAGKADIDAAVDAICGNDRFEPNDDDSNAKQVTEGQVTDLDICGGEYDIFTVDLTAGRSLSASIEFDHGTGDLDLGVYAPNRTLLNASISETDDESVAVDSAPTSGTYYVLVTGRDGASASYDLTVDTGIGSLVKSHQMCTDVSEDAPRCPEGTVNDTFTGDDERAISWVEFGEMSSSHRVVWNWYTPAGEQYRTIEQVINEDDEDASGWFAWTWIDVKDDEPARMPGEWNVEVVVDGERAFTETFTIESDRDTAGDFTTRNLSTTEVPAGGTVEVTLTAEFEDAHDRVSVSDGFGGPVESATIEAIRIDGEDASDAVLFETAGPDSAGIALQGIEAGSTLEIVYAVEIEDDAEEGATVTFTGRDGGADVTAGEVTGTFGVETVSVTEAAGPVVQADRNGDGTITTGELRFAIRNWAAGEFTTDELRAVIRAWARS